jgi:hypothetical protein
LFFAAIDRKKLYFLQTFKAIDDVFVSRKTCASPASCAFEDADNGLCTWMNTENNVDDFDWKIISTYLNSSFGLIPDYTLGSTVGHFAIANGFKNKNFARIYSEKLDSNTDTGVCLRFYYYFKGSMYFIKNSIT